MRGFAISFLTLARVALLDPFLAFLCCMHPMITSRWKPCNPIWHSCEICGSFMAANRGNSKHAIKDENLDGVVRARGWA